MPKIKFLLLLCLPLFAAVLPAQTNESVPTQEDTKTTERPPFIIPRDEINRMRAESKMAIGFIEQNHYRQLHLDEIDPEELIDSYLEELDYNKMFFLKKDRDDIMARFKTNIVKANLSRGNLYPAFEIFKIYRQRMLDRLDWIYARLEQDFDFTTDRTFEPDRSEKDYPLSIAEADDLWERRVTYEMLLEVINDETIEKARDRLSHRYHRIERYLLNIEPHNVQERFLNAYCALFDPHTNFFSVETAEDFEIATKNSLVGIGAVLTDEDGYCTIRELMPGGPAEMSNQLLPGDIILGISQDEGTPVDIVDMKLSKVVQMIRGEKGSKIYLHVQSADSDERKVVVLVRDEIELTSNLASATVNQIPNEDGTVSTIGVIDLPSFYGESGDGKPAPTTSEDVEELIRQLKEYHIDGLVLDLRHNGGGLLSETIKLVGLFIKKGPVVMVRASNGAQRADWDRDSKVAYDGPLSVLIDRNSASASEITAGALQALGRAIIIGDSTSHGKGTVQLPWFLENSMRQINPFAPQEKMGMIKVTIQKFYLPNGSSTQKKGVTSDIFIPNINEYLPIGEADLDNVLEWDTVPTVKWEPSEVLPDHTPVINTQLIDYLKARSQMRRDKLEEFDFLQRQIDHFEEIQERKVYSLNLDIRKKQKEENKKFKEDAEAEQDKLAKHPYDSTELELAVTKEREEQHQEKLMNSTLPDGRTKANAYYQKNFYYLNPETDEIKVINLENFDYEKLLDNTEEIAETLKQASGLDVTEDITNHILNDLKNSDAGSDFQVEKTLREYYPDLTNEQIQDFMPAVCLKLIELDSDILLEKPKLDIKLREAMRITADWIEYTQGHKFLNAQEIKDAVARSDSFTASFLEEATADR
jgi:carboxyl-terminal processing protease